MLHTSECFGCVLCVHACVEFLSSCCNAALMWFSVGELGRRLVTLGSVWMIWLCTCVRVCLCVSFRPSSKVTTAHPSASRPAAQTTEQPRGQYLLQPAQCEFKARIEPFVRLCLLMIIELNVPVPEPWATRASSWTSSSPTLRLCCLQHGLLLFICCFHVRMSAFTVNNWCGLSKPSKMHASSGSPQLSLIKKIMLWLLILSASVRIQRKNHFELKINDSRSFVHLLVFSDSLWLFACVCVFVLSTESSRLPGEQEEAQKTWVNSCLSYFLLSAISKQTRPFVEVRNQRRILFSANVNSDLKIRHI